MKSFSLLTSIIVAISSIALILYREHILEIAHQTTPIATLLDKISTYVSSGPTTTPLAVSSEDLDLQTSVLFPSDTHLEVTAMSVARTIRKVFEAIEQAEGAGARVRRSIGTPQLRNFSPFLMLDHFSISKGGGGFPDHPHRGQETITYLLSGAVDHEDFAGNKGTIEAGDLQFMTAGKGIVHAEMPGQNPDGSANVGLQLWVDLPTKLKMCEPRYRDLKAKEIPSVDIDDGKVHVKVISGQSHGVDSVKDLAYTPVWILDIEIKPGGKIAQPVPTGWNAFAYTLEGQTVFGKAGNQTAVEQYHNVVFEPKGDVVYAEVDAGAEKKARFVLVAGTPLDQNVVQYGPFVLTSKDEVYQAIKDYQTHSGGFERAEGWESEIGKSMLH